MLDFFKGKKTYIVAFLMVVVNGLYMSGTIDAATRDALMQLLGAGAVATVAAKVNRVNKRVEDKY